MNISLKLILGSGAQLLSRLISTLSTLVITYLITQNLSREVWGDFVTIISFIAIFTLIADFGLNGIVIKKIANDQTKEAEYFRELFGLRLVLGLGSMFVALAILSVLPYPTAVKLGVIVGSFTLQSQSLYTTAKAIFQAKSRFDRFAISDIVGSLVILFLIFIAIEMKAGLLTIVFVYLLGNFAQSLLGVYFAQKLVAVRGFGFNFRSWLNFLVAALPLGIMVVLIQINANIDKQILALSNYSVIGGVSAAIAVGIYGLAYRVFDLAIALPSYVTNFAYPFMLNNQKENPETFSREVRNLALVLLGVGVFVAGVLWILAPVVIGIFGNYPQAVVPLRILLLGVPVFFVTPLLLWTAVTLNKEILLPFIYGFATLVTVVLNLVFVPQFGYRASAWATVISEIVILSGLFLILSEINLLKPLKRDENSS